MERKKKLAAAIILLLSEEKDRSCYARQINMMRNELGEHVRLFQEIKNDQLQFFIYTRMSVDIFYMILKKIEPMISIKRWTVNTITPESRLAMTLRFLSQGDSLQALAWAYRCGKSTVHGIVNAVSVILWQSLSKDYLTVPSRDSWRDIGEKFWNIWNVPNCVGAIDGKHIKIEAPPNSGSLYFNYKKQFSTVLMACCDATYKFTLVNVGDVGSSSDGGTFAASKFGQRIANGTMELPEDKCLPKTNINFGHYFVGDEVFPLKPNLLRPYPGRNLSEARKIFNYRLSRARRTIENAFGILVARWRVLKKEITANPEYVHYYVLAAICLHNFLLVELATEYCPPTFVDHEGETGELIEGLWRNVESQSLLSQVTYPRGNRPNTAALSMRDTLCDYVNNQGAVPWQLSVVQSTGPSRHNAPR